MRKLITTRTFEDEQKLADYDNLARELNFAQAEINEISKNRDEWIQYSESLNDTINDIESELAAKDELIEVLRQELLIRRQNEVSRTKMAVLN
ncbi:MULTISPECIES: hypothetical protein [unclassified Lactococcus]|uniref:hypothetical protein n=1 Tax=unclassified Lactococcus TaxID=2643510 RepID=UPI0011CCD09C|nr:MULTISPECIES: hypothetical protein [unclassified Lactococcus]TXK33901.1 hypothetical protein FVP42_11430 [Lactococcus sp. dk310]TXK45326.1 hypothetical protein FVP43_11500 [Lactococcus sp. dk322]